MWTKWWFYWSSKMYRMSTAIESKVNFCDSNKTLPTLRNSVLSLSHGHGHGQLRQCKKHPSMLTRHQIYSTYQMSNSSLIMITVLRFLDYISKRNTNFHFNKIHLFINIMREKNDDLTQWQLILFTCSNTNAKWLIGICAVKWNKIYDAKKLFDWN